MRENIGNCPPPSEYPRRFDPWDLNGYFALSSLYTAAVGA